MSLSGPSRAPFERIYSTCIFLTICTSLIAPSRALAQQQAGASKAPAATQAGAVPVAPLTQTTDQPKAASPTPKVDSVTVFSQPLPQTASATPPRSTFVLEISGTDFVSISDMSSLRIIVFPPPDGGEVQAVSLSQDKTKIFAQFTAPANYALEQVALSITKSDFVAFSTGTSACDFESKVILKPQIVSNNQAANKYGRGVAKNFHVIQLAIVNECPMAITIPLGGISVVPDTLRDTQAKGDACQEREALVPFSLDHVTSVFSTDRKLTGIRAIYFNAVQAAAALGSAVEPFFAPGFTQGVAILGGGFTTASKDIFVDMSAEQLQNLTSQSFGATEQISASGSLQKFVFVRRNIKCKKGTVETDLKTGNFSVKFELTPASAQAPTTQSAPAVPPPDNKKPS